MHGDAAPHMGAQAFGNRPRNIPQAIELMSTRSYQGEMSWNAQLLTQTINAFRAKMSKERRFMDLMARTSVRSTISSSTRCPDALAMPS
jgi:hypothetical protein